MSAVAHFLTKIQLQTLSYMYAESNRSTNKRVRNRNCNLPILPLPPLQGGGGGLGRLAAAVQKAVGGHDFAVDVVSVYGRHDQTTDPDHMPRPSAHAQTRPPLSAQTFSQHQPAPTTPLDSQAPDNHLQSPRPPDTEPEANEPRRTPLRPQNKPHEPHTPPKPHQPQPLRHPTVNRTSVEEPTSPPTQSQKGYSFTISPPTFRTPTAAAAHFTPSTCVWVSVKDTAARFMDPVKLRGLLALHTREVCTFMFIIIVIIIIYTIYIMGTLKHCNTLFYHCMSHLECSIAITQSFYAIPQTT